MSLFLRQIVIIIALLNFTPYMAYSQESIEEPTSESTQEEDSSEVAIPEKKEIFSPQIEWEEPEVKNTKNPKVLEVSLHGVTEKNVRVRVGKQILWIVVDKKGKKKVKKLPAKRLKIKGKKIVELNSDGSFSIHLKMPKGEVQIPVGLIQGKQSARYQLALFVKDQKIEIKDQPKVQTDCRYCIWLGAGFTYLSYQQDPPQDIKPIDYGAFGFPALTFRTWVQIVKNWKVRFAYHHLVGPELSTSDGGITITDKSIAWTQIGLELDYRALKSFRLLGLKFDPAILVGVQNHDMPFLVQSSGSIFTIESFKFNTVSVGGLFFINNQKKWYYELFMRLQTAVSSSGEVKLSSGFAFDGSIGGVYRFTEKVRLGIFWGGQYHNYKYEISSTPGTYSLLNSKIDLALGYEF